MAGSCKGIGNLCTRNQKIALGMPEFLMVFNRNKDIVSTCPGARLSRIAGAAAGDNIVRVTG